VEWTQSNSINRQYWPLLAFGNKPTPTFIKAIFMNRRYLLHFLALTVLFASRGALAQAPFATMPPSGDAAHPPLRIVIVGDSTVCNYPAARPERGWGMFIEEHFKPGSVKVINLAASGRSTKTFIKEGRWGKALAEKPEYVLIQFGHNDSHSPDKPEATDAATDYKDYLRRYVDDLRAINATPILVTPMVRRTFGTDGKLQDDLQRYTDAMKEVGAEKKVPVIDLHASSKNLVEQLGPEASAELANKKGDNTHFNEKGARAMADLVMKELPASEPKLREYLKVP
jgi:lysophospholipase L1-like esterase